MKTEQDAEFTALVERQGRFVFRVAYAVLLDGHDAEDAVQEVFLKLYRNGGWQRADNERAFLARVAWRVAVDRRRTTPSPATLDDAEESIDLPSLQPGPEQALVAANQHAVVHSMIDVLPEELRLPLVLAAFDEFNSRQIGAILGIPEGTVRTRIQRARQILRERLANLQTRNGVSNQEAQHA